jgi:hypothetical protein
MSDTKVGVPPPKGAGRDAIHMAVTPAVASEFLSPGEHVGRLSDGTFHTSAKALGIVDPFLMEGVEKGETFWLFLYPQTITGLTHVWTHPAFVDEPSTPEVSPEPTVPEIVARSRRWLEDFARQWDVSYQTVLDAGAGRETIYSGDYEADVPNAFWHHYQVVTGVSGSGEQFFRCAC